MQQMQPKAKKARLSLSKAKKNERLPDGIYDKEIVFPPGIANIGNNCYANSVLQCLFNHPTFETIICGAIANHAEECTTSCEVRGNYIRNTVHDGVACYIMYKFTINTGKQCILKAVMAFKERYVYAKGSPCLVPDEIVWALKGEKSTG